MKILWTCCRCGVETVTEKQPDTVTNEPANIPRGWVYWLSQAYCPRHVVRTKATVTVVP